MSAVGPRPLRHTLTALVCTVMVTFGVACGTANAPGTVGQGTAPTPTFQPTPFPTKGPHLSPVPTPTPNPNGMATYAVAVDFGPPPTPEQLVQWYGLIVSGRVVDLLPAQWTTPDGKRPANASADTVPFPYRIITPVIIELDRAPLVDHFGTNITSGRIVVATFGGTVDHDQVLTNDPSQHLQVGQHVLLGLTDHPYLRGVGRARYQTPAGLAWNVGVAYTLTDNGQAIPPQPTASSLVAKDFIAAIVAAGSKQP